MQEILIQKLHHYVSENNPDLLIQLQGESRVTAYLQEKVAAIDEILKELLTEEKPSYIIEELCLNELTKDLKPSRFNYLKEILEEEFNEHYQRLRDAGIVTTELINLIQTCQPVFDELNFTEENEESRFIRYAITGAISEYLKGNSENENVSNGLQQSTETEG